MGFLLIEDFLYARISKVHYVRLCHKLNSVLTHFMYLHFNNLPICEQYCIKKVCPAICTHTSPSINLHKRDSMFLISCNLISEIQRGPILFLKIISVPPYIYDVFPLDVQRHPLYIQSKSLLVNALLLVEFIYQCNQLYILFFLSEFSEKF